MGAPETTGSHEMKSSVILSFLTHLRDVIQPRGSGHYSNYVYTYKITTRAVSTISSIFFTKRTAKKLLIFYYSVLESNSGPGAGFYAA